MGNAAIELAQRVARAAQHSESESAQAEDADHHRNAPSPDEACLYGLVGDIARAGSDTTEANPYAIALNVLAYLGCCIGRGPYLPIGNTYHHARLFGMHVGRSGRGRKGDAVSLVHRIDNALRTIDASLAPQIHRGGLSSREGLAHLIHDGYTDGAKEVAPINDKRLWVIESEFANVLHQTKRDGNTLSAALRDCWDGIGIKPATKSNRIAASDPHVGLSAAVTPTELLSLMQTRELSNGFANRFLVIYSERSKLLPFPAPTTHHVVNQLAQKVADVLRHAGAHRWVDRDCKRMSLSSEAQVLYADLYRRELNRHDFGPLVTGLLERRAPMLLRIAMIFALTDETFVIEARHVEAALAWVRYWVDSVRFIFNTGAQEQAQREVTAAAGKIIAFLKGGRKARTAISSECFRGKLSKDKLDAAIEELLQTTPPTIVVEIEERKDGPGSPTKFYKLAANSAKSANPECFRGVADGLRHGEVSEVSEFSPRTDHDLTPDFARLRSVRQTENGPGARINAHSSQTSLISPASSDDAEVF